MKGESSPAERPGIPPAARPSAGKSTPAPASSAVADNSAATSAPVPNPDAWTIKRILAWTTEHLKKHGSESPKLESEILLAHACNCQRIQLYARFNDELSESVRATMRELVKRRVQREPVAYLVGFREFYSLRFAVGPGVFIPRPETETLVAKTLERIAAVPTPQVLELCTGSGCIAVTVAVRQPQARVIAIDASPTACEFATRNAAQHQVSERVRVLQGDLFAPLQTSAAASETPRQFDVIVSNPPYVCDHELAELAPEIRDHEPTAALISGADGLDAIRRILAEGPRLLKPDGWLLLEMDPTQIAPVLQLATATGQFDLQETYLDLFGKKRCVGLRKAR